MTTFTKRSFLKSLCLGVGLFAATLTPAHAASDVEVDALADAALEKLYAENSAAQTLAEAAAGILIFPKVTKAGLGVGGEAGKGVLRVGEIKDGYYRTLSISLGAQAGFQTYGYVMMFMTPEALAKFKSQKGYELGVDGSIAVIDAGATVEVDTKNIKEEIIGIVFDESGLMASATIEGSKITRLDD